MFGSRKRGRESKIDTLIGKETEIQGNVVFGGGLMVEGVVRGSVTATEGDESATLTVAAGAAIEGDVRVPRAILDGTVTGDVHASELVELAPNARVSGNIYYKRIEMAIGAEVNGQLIHVQAESPPAPGNN